MGRRETKKKISRENHEGWKIEYKGGIILMRNLEKRPMEMINIRN